MREILITLLLFLNIQLFGNMASPIWHGTSGASPFISKYVDIIREKIKIIPDKNFEKAQFKIEYEIKTSRSGEQIPLLFYAMEYENNFKIWIDGNEVPIKEITSELSNSDDSPFNDFTSSFGKSHGANIVNWDDNYGHNIGLNDLKYFTLDLQEGIHKVYIEYTANRWLDRSDFVTEYSFRYSLSPAKYWKSFGDLEIILDNSLSGKTIKTNLNSPVIGTLDSIAIWNFDKLPSDYLKIDFKPELNYWAKTLIVIDPISLSLLLLLTLAILHFLLLKNYKKNNPSKPHFRILITGSIIIPFLACASYMLFYSLIDHIIGEHASRHHGYTFMIFIFYIPLILGYFFLFWFIEWIFKQVKRNK